MIRDGDLPDDMPRKPAAGCSSIIVFFFFGANSDCHAPPLPIRGNGSSPPDDAPVDRQAYNEWLLHPGERAVGGRAQCPDDDESSDDRGKERQAEWE